MAPGMAIGIGHIGRRKKPGALSRFKRGQSVGAWILRLYPDHPQAQMLGKGTEVLVAMEQLQVVFDAACRNQRVNGLPDGNAQAA